MDNEVILWLIFMICAAFVSAAKHCDAQADVYLPRGVNAVWDLSKAYRETTPTRERICINGLWRWQPIKNMTDEVPTDGWGYVKVPGPWPGTVGGYMWRETQTHYPHPSWQAENLRNVDMAWYQREFTIPKEWAGRRVAVDLEYLNSYAAVYVDNTNMGEVYFPGGTVEITSACRPGSKHVLSLLVKAMSLKAVIASFSDTNAPQDIESQVARRGLCGDVFLVSTPAQTHLDDVKVETSVRQWEITFDTALQGVSADGEYHLHARITDNGRNVKEFRSKRFTAADLKSNRFTFTGQWKPDKLWDVHTPQNLYNLQLSLLDSEGNALDIHQPVRFGFREFWIDGRDFRLNGTRFYCFAVPLDNAQIGAAAASYDGARETMLRLKALGVNTVYTHNYGCKPGSHLSFAEILQAADDVGMLISLSQPHFAHYDWEALDADETNGYAQHAQFYVRMAQNHPSVVMYSMSHNATGYSEDMNPDLIDGIHAKRDSWSANNAKLALRAEALVKQFDSTRVIYHHAGGNLGPMHTSNFYLNFVPIQERSDWFEHWATEGVKPVFLFEYGAPWGMNWTLYRGWYEGKRDFGSAKLPWQFCTSEWNSQFLGDRAYQLTEMEKENLRFEAKQAWAGKRWHRWDYPFPIIGSYSRGYDNKEEVWGMYITDNWRAYRTWGLSGFNVWSYGNFWKLRDGVDKSRKTFNVDWNNLQKPGFSPDFQTRRYERIDTAYKREDWIPTRAAKALLRNNQPLLAYIGGKPTGFTSKDHNFHPGETVEKQLIIINNSRETVTCDCAWSFGLPQVVSGSKKVNVPTGEQERMPLRFTLSDTLAPGEYKLTMRVNFGLGRVQEDSFVIHVLPRAGHFQIEPKIALFDPKGETAKLLDAMGIIYEPIDANSDISSYSVLIVGKAALTVDGPAPDIGSVRDGFDTQSLSRSIGATQPKGLKVLMLEQNSAVLEKRLGFRVQEYGLRRVFKRVPDHPVLTGLETEHLRDWRGEATIVPPRLEYELRPRYGPTIEWCDIKVARAWRCGCYGNVASVLIEKPTIGDFLPLVDGGFNLQYSPLMEYREGEGVILFCQMDVIGRTEDDAAAKLLVANMLQYVSEYSPKPRRTALYVGAPEGRLHFEQAGLLLDEYKTGILTSEQFLVVGPGGGAQLAPHRKDIATWLKSGGHILAIGTDEQEARAFLPFGVTMNPAEHICTYFEPARMKSLLTGIGPAEVQIRNPHQLPLVTDDAALVSDAKQIPPTPFVKGGDKKEWRQKLIVVGNGVLAFVLTAKAELRSRQVVDENANVVFCQLVPWQFDYQKLYHFKMTFRRTSFLVTRLLANMGVSGVTPMLSRFSSPVAEDVETQMRWLTGLYLDQPVEMDDPYRFFRW